MSGNRLMEQVMTIFSTFMVLMGLTFIFYGLFRAFRAYVKIKEVFFTDEDKS